MINPKELEKLAKRSSSFAETRNGITYLLENKQWVHSRYDPRKEAQRLMKEILSCDPENTLLIFLGCGLGYHVELAELAGFKNALLVEKKPKLFEIFSQIYHLPDSYHLFGPTSKELDLDFYLSTMEIHHFKKIKTVSLRGAYETDLYLSFEKRLDRLLKVKLGDFTTRLKFEELWFIHILNNIPSILTSANVLRLFTAFKETPVVVISAGPSLPDSISQIREWKKHAFLIAVDTALLVLYEAGIQPDFVYSLDSQIYNLNDFSMIPQDYLKDIVLIYDVVVHPALAEKYPGPKIAANTAHLDFDQNGHPFVVKNEFVSWIEIALGRIGDVETGGSVATSAFHFAYLIGGNPVILCGQDLAYTHYQSHSVSTPHYYRLSTLSTRLKPLESIFMGIMQKRNPKLMEGIHEEVFSDFMLTNFKGWFEESAKNLRLYLNNDIYLINASAQGVKIKYFDHHRENLFLAGSNLPNRERLKTLSQTKFVQKSEKRRLLKLLREMNDFIQNISLQSTLFEQIKHSEYSFLIRYFMKEKIVFDRYGKVDSNILDRKLNRLKKNLGGVIDEIKTSY